MSDDWFLGYSAGDKVKILSDVRIREENKKWYDRLVKVINNFAKRYVDEPPCSCQNNWDAYGEFPNCEFKHLDDCLKDIKTQKEWFDIHMPRCQHVYDIWHMNEDLIKILAGKEIIIESNLINLQDDPCFCFKFGNRSYRLTLNYFELDTGKSGGECG